MLKMTSDLVPVWSVPGPWRSAHSVIPRQAFASSNLSQAQLDPAPVYYSPVHCSMVQCFAAAPVQWKYFARLAPVLPCRKSRAPAG
jgi:hypothetical protein